MRTEGNLLWRDDAGDEVLEELLERRAHGTVGRLRLRGVKLFQDGVVESHTAAMLAPYRDADGSVTERVRREPVRAGAAAADRRAARRTGLPGSHPRARRQGGA